jgi:transposase
MGHHLASWLLARGERVVDVPPRSTARVRQLSRGGRRKNDRIDAAAAACVAALAGDANPLQPDGPAEALALLDERRSNLAQARVRTANQLHALLRALLAGGAPRDLSATTAEKLIASVRPAGQVERIRIQLATDLVTDLRSLDAQLRANAKEMAKLVAQSGSTLTSIPGIGAVTAARLIGRTGPGQPLPQRRRLRQLHRRRADRTRQRRPHPPPPVPLWRPATQLRAAHRGSSRSACRSPGDTGTTRPRSRKARRPAKPNAA